MRGERSGLRLFEPRSAFRDAFVADAYALLIVGHVCCHHRKLGDHTVDALFDGRAIGNWSGGGRCLRVERGTNEAKKKS